MGEHEARPISRTRYAHGEGMRWDDRRHELLWVDISAHRFLRASPDAPDSTHVHDAGMPVGVVAPRTSGGWVLGAGRGFVTVDEDGTQRALAEVEPEGNRMNDGAVDAAGRFWVGSMAYDERRGAGSLHTLDADGTVRTMLTGLTISNGIGWSPDTTVMYLNDSGAAVTWAFDVDAATGTPSARRVLVQHDPAQGVGDGLLVDSEGFLWVPLWGGSAVHRYDPAGRLADTVRVSARQPTACCLAGGTLYITSACKGLSDPGPDDGCVFACEVGIDAPAVTPWPDGTGVLVRNDEDDLPL